MTNTTGARHLTPAQRAALREAAENAELTTCEHSAHLHWHYREGPRPGDEVNTALVSPSAFLSLLDENEEVRKALTKIAYEPIGDAETTDREMWRAMEQIARAALSEEVKDDTK